jgi:hypothetical protein
MTTIFEDVVECRGCGAEITHVCCGVFPTRDDDYYLCDSCMDETTEDDEAE